MPRRPYASNAAAIEQARAFMDAGLPVASVERRPDGGIIVRLGQPLSGDDLTPDPALRRLLQHAEGQENENDGKAAIRG